MAFRFSLRALLRLRQSYEERERLRLAAVTSRLYQLRSQYEDWKREKQRAEMGLVEIMKAGMVAVEFHFATASLAAENRRLKLMLAEIAKVEQEYQAQQAAYAEARKKCKILERLRERQMEAYQLEQGRREQQQVDDLFAMRQGARHG